jgi:type IV pilus biogenesis protein CpaD/CtpE
MTFDHTQITKSLVSVVLVAAAALAGGCSTDSGTKKASSADPAQETEYLSAAEVRKDPDRVICRRHKPTGSRISEKICMTARQWQQASDDTARTLDRAQRTTGGTDGQ